MLRKLLVLLLLSVFVSACFHPISTDEDIDDSGKTQQQPDPGPDPIDQPVLDKKKYFQLKPNTSGAFEKSLKTYLSSTLSDNYFYRGSGVAEFSDTGSTAATGGGGGGNGGAAGTTAPATDASESSSSSNVSSTNLIEQGVDEADLIKSDGKYLYVARNHQNYYYGGGIGIGAAVTDEVSSTSDAAIAPTKETQKSSILIYALDTATPRANPTLTIDLAQDITRIHGLYLNNNTQSNTQQLIVLTSAALNDLNNYQEITRVISYDLSDPQAPTVSWALDIDGSSISSRLLNGKLLLITRQYLDLYKLTEPYIANEKDDKATRQQAIEKITVDDVLPETRIDTELVNLVDASDCIVPVSANAQSYFDNSLTTILTIPLTNPDTTDAICTLESSGEIYVSPNALYMTKNDYVQDLGEGTLIHKFALNNSGLSYRASGRVAGTIGWRNNAFRMSEHEDYFRLVTSVSQSYNDNPDLPSIGAPIWRGSNQTHHLFILKEDKTSVGQLTTVSQLPNENLPAAIGKPGEQIYGVRFNGNYGYVVTFKKVDPLYVLNLTDPLAPFIEGELELPGYSDYLHPVSENILIGLGKDAVEESGTAFYQGIKVGIFDISDKTNPQVIQESIIGKRGTDSIALSNHHAFTYFDNKDSGVVRFAFPVTIHGGEPAYYNNNSASTYYKWQSSGLQLFSLSEESGTLNFSNDGLLTVATANSGGTNNFYFENPRALFVDDAVFLADKSEVWASNWYTPNTVNTTVNQESVSITGYISFSIGDPGDPNGSPLYYMAITDSTSGQTITIEYPSVVIDDFTRQNNIFGKLVTVTGILISAPGEAPRKIRATSIAFAE